MEQKPSREIPTQNYLSQEEWARRAKDTEEALRAGQLPAQVTNRLDAMREGQLPFTSSFRVKEWAALRKFQFLPLGQVMGSSIYHIGWSRLANAGFYFSQSFEIEAPTSAMMEARKIALGRMQQEAMALHAHAVVGVRLEKVTKIPEENIIEFIAVGTAIRLEGKPTPKSPILATVSGQDFVRLIEAGAMPVGLAMGVSYYYLMTDWRDFRQQFSLYNQEMGHFQQGVARVRTKVMKRMIDDAHALEASGVIGADFHLTVEEVEREVSENQSVTDHILDVVALGTAVEHSSQQPKPHIITTISLND